MSLALVIYALEAAVTALNIALIEIPDGEIKTILTDVQEALEGGLQGLSGHTDLVAGRGAAKNDDKPKQPGDAPADAAKE